jgi:hypothetical protein
MRQRCRGPTVNTTGTDANCGLGVVPSATVPIVAVVAVPPDLRSRPALGNLDALGLGRSDERGSRQQRGAAPPSLLARAEEVIE